MVEQNLGMGDRIRRVTERLGIEECDGCKHRQELLNNATRRGFLGGLASLTLAARSLFGASATLSEVIAFVRQLNVKEVTWWWKNQSCTNDLAALLAGSKTVPPAGWDVTLIAEPDAWSISVTDGPRIVTSGTNGFIYTGESIAELEPIWERRGGILERFYNNAFFQCPNVCIDTLCGCAGSCTNVPLQLGCTGCLFNCSCGSNCGYCYWCGPKATLHCCGCSYSQGTCSGFGQNPPTCGCL